MKATWLFDEHPLIIDVKLAKVIGLNEAVVLQQVNYWLHSKHAKRIDGRTWTYNSMKEWQKQFPFWGLNTVKRTFSSLEKDGLLITGNYNKYKFDKTKWYSIDVKKLNNRMAQNGPMEEPRMGRSDWPKMGQPIPDNTDTTTETNSNSQAGPDNTSHIRKEVIDYLNQKLGTSYKPNAFKNKKAINARVNEGYTVEDFKTVINNKVNDWGNDSKMSKYLRPETLFGTKFDSYLNEVQISSQQTTHQGKDWFAGFNRE